MIHRALFGSVERFFAILLEHYAGAFPTWLAPEQVRVLPVRDDHEAYADAVAAGCAAAGLRGVDRGRRRAARRPDPQGQAARRSPTSWWWATTTSRPAPSGSTGRGTDRPERGVPLDALRGRACRPRSRRTAARAGDDRRVSRSSSSGPAGGSEYVERGHRGRARRRPTTAASSAASRPAGRPRRQRGGVAGRADASPSSTPTPTPAGTCWSCRSATSAELGRADRRRSRRRCGRRTAAAVAAVDGRLPARRGQPRGQPGPGGRGRHPRPPPPARRCPAGPATPTS